MLSLPKKIIGAMPQVHLELNAMQEMWALKEQTKADYNPMDNAVCLCLDLKFIKMFYVSFVNIFICKSRNPALTYYRSSKL